MRRQLKVYFVFAVLLQWGFYVNADSVFKPKHLSLNAGYSLTGIEGLEPSGLDYCDGRLLFVSDKHGNQIFELNIVESQAIASVYLTLPEIPPPTSIGPAVSQPPVNYIANYMKYFDWEGISCDGQGNIYLASEFYVSILKINKQRKVSWIEQPLYEFGQRNGLFTKHNAYLEGISVQGEKLWLAAEREPRGLLLINDGRPEVIVAPEYESKETRMPLDFAGLDIWQGTLYALERNHYQVCGLADTKVCYSYGHVVEEWEFLPRIFGTAEGLAIEGGTLWLIFDNNQKPRLANPDNSRPTLLSFTFPAR